MEEKKVSAGIPEILDLGDIAELLRVTKQTARRYIDDGRIPACKISGGKYLTTRRQIMRTIEERCKTVEKHI